MESKRFNKDLKLLPRYFKKVGLAVMSLALIISIWFLPIKPNRSATEKNLSLMLTYDMLLVGLLFIAFSRDKIEDEMTSQIRLRSMAFSFFWVIFSVILTPIINLIFNDQV